MSRLKFLIILCLLLISSATMLAQENCDAIVQTAIDTAAENCDGLRRNEACYGNVTIDAEAAPDVDEFAFDTAGDIVSVGDIASMRLSSQVDGTGEWGIGIMRLQANLSPNSTDAVSVVVFGDVVLDNQINASDIPVALQVTATGAVNVRQSPVNGNVLDALAAGETVTAIGRNADGSWIRIQDSEQNLGWVSGQFLQGDDLTLPVVDTDYEGSNFTAMQAFIFNSRETEADCDAIPQSGLLIQVPEGAGIVQLQINEVIINLGSTAYLRTSDDTLSVYLLQGTADVSTQGNIQLMPPGTQVDIPLDPSTNIAAGAPTVPRPYAISDVENLPLSLGNDLETPIVEAISVAEPVPGQEIEQTLRDLYAPDGAVTGTYRFERTLRDPWGSGQSALLCPAGELQSFERFIDLATLYDAGYQRPLLEVAPSIYGDLPAEHDNIRPENYSGGFTLNAKTYFVQSPTQLEYWSSFAQQSDQFGAQACRQRWIGQLIQRGE